MDMNESLLRAIFATVVRGTFAPETVHRIVAPKKNSEKNVAVYNHCDGNTPQADIAKRAKLDQGNFSRLLTRWIEAGIIVRVGEDEHPLHVYPLSKDSLKEKKE
jgi:hypothetical protein